MARSSEVVRQWEILRAIDGARNGIAVGKLASERTVCERTIRRDLSALQRAGFPLYDEKVNGTSMWKLRAKPFARLEEMGLSLMELCALYFSRTMMDTLVGTPLVGDTERAFLKIEKALPAGCKKFIDQLPRLLTAKAGGRKKREVEAPLPDAAAHAPNFAAPKEKNSARPILLVDVIRNAAGNHAGSRRDEADTQPRERSA